MDFRAQGSGPLQFAERPVADNPSASVGARRVHLLVQRTAGDTVVGPKLLLPHEQQGRTPPPR